MHMKIPCVLSQLHWTSTLLMSCQQSQQYCQLPPKCPPLQCPASCPPPIFSCCGFISGSDSCCLGLHRLHLFHQSWHQSRDDYERESLGAPVTARGCCWPGPWGPLKSKCFFLFSDLLLSTSWVHHTLCRLRRFLSWYSQWIYNPQRLVWNQICSWSFNPIQW